MITVTQATSILDLADKFFYTGEQQVSNISALVGLFITCTRYMFSKDSSSFLNCFLLSLLLFQ